VPFGYDLYENNKAAAFEQIKKTGETYITNPLTTLEGELAIYVWIPLHLENGSFEGAIVAIIEIDEITKQTIKTEYESGYVYLIDDNAKLLYDSSDDHVLISSACRQKDFQAADSSLRRTRTVSSKRR
jgi:hypothetical protein